MKPSTKDQIKGKIDEMEGKVKEKTGQVTNDPNLEAEGQAEKLAGKVQNLGDHPKAAIDDHLKTGQRAVQRVPLNGLEPGQLAAAGFQDCENVRAEG